MRVPHELLVGEHVIVEKYHLIIHFSKSSYYCLRVLKHVLRFAGSKITPFDPEGRQCAI